MKPLKFRCLNFSRGTLILKLTLKLLKYQEIVIFENVEYE